MSSLDLFAMAALCLKETELEKKLAMSRATVQESENGFFLDQENVIENVVAGRPPSPRLVAPARLPRRGFSSPEARLALVHAIAHIEFNAINLAWDAVCRFQTMPVDYYRDWVKVAGEETKHFMLLRAFLNKNKLDYGDYDAHDGLWKMAEQTSYDVLARMAIVPRVLEARGLDVTPAMIEKFKEHGEQEVVDILKVIYQEEIGHVKIGNKWFNYLCRQRQLDSDSFFRTLLKKFRLQNFSTNFNREARLEAGFEGKELDLLEQGFVPGIHN